MPVDWTAGISAPDFPYPSHWNPATLACRDWHTMPRAAWKPGYARLIRFHQRYAVLPKGHSKDELLSPRLPTLWTTHRQQCCCLTVGEEKLVKYRHEAKQEEGKQDSTMASLRGICRTVVCMCHGLKYMSPLPDLSQELRGIGQVRKMHEVARLLVLLLHACEHA
jgi:hypothetical protein